MQLNRIRLENFRQHQCSEIVLGSGLTGIIGPNGVGKTTILEAIAWAIYGTPAARGKVDSIKFARAKPRQPVRVEIDFTLGPSEYRVTRSLRDAVIAKDGRPIANAPTTVTAHLTRLLGMSRSEFFNTYFTGQKQIAVMAAMGPTERGQFLSRLLGYERLRQAQERLRDVRSRLRGETEGLQAAIVADEILAAERRDVEENLQHARSEVRLCERRKTQTAGAVREIEPAWRGIRELRERSMELHSQHRIAEAAVKTTQSQFQGLDHELAYTLRARDDLAELESQLAPLAQWRKELQALEAAAHRDGERREWKAQLAELNGRMATLDDKLKQTAGVGVELTREETALAEARAEVHSATERARELRMAWVRDKQDAETKRQALRDQYRDTKKQHDLIKRLGPEGTCPTCQRPLGDHYSEVLEDLKRQLEDIEVNGGFFTKRLEQLAMEPTELLAAEQARRELEGRIRATTEKVGTLKEARREREAMLGEQEQAALRVADLSRLLAQTEDRYDPARHDAVRRQVRELEPVEKEATKLGERAGRAEQLVRRAEQAERELSDKEQHLRRLVAAIETTGYRDEEFAAQRERFERAGRAQQEAVVALAEARGRLTAATQAHEHFQRREQERQHQLERIAELKAKVRLHHELDRAFSDLRTDLNARIGPELSELASSFLVDLTGGRYEEFILDDRYQVTILEDGKPKPVLSGGEEDIANLVLRLAVSQLVAERAGQPLSLLVLDEIFGSLDEERRQLVVDLLRRVGDRFPQVILITHIESVRQGLDRVIRVTFDPATGASVVRDDAATAGVSDEDVAA